MSETTPSNGMERQLIGKTESTDKKTDRPWLFKKGQSGNPAGRPLGSRNFTTDFDEAVEEIAKANGITISEARKILFKVAYSQAKDANFPFYKDIMDRYYGKALENVDMTVRTPEPLLDVLHNNSDKKDSSSVEED